jgi:nitroreductase
MRDLFEIMWQRHTCRAAFDPQREIREPDLQHILDAARWAPTAHNMQNYEIIAVDDKHCLAAISALPLPPTETFIRENYHSLSLSDAELLQRRTGLSASMFPESWQEAEAAQDDSAAVRHTYVGRTIQECPLLLVVVHDSRPRAPASEGDALGLMSLGCVMQNLWLMAESLGISMQILSAFSANAVEDQVKCILAIPKHMKIAFAARLGYPVTGSESYLRVRRKIQDFTHRNHYSVREHKLGDGLA